MSMLISLLSLFAPFDDGPRWTFDRFDSDGEVVESNELALPADATAAQIADAIMQVDRAQTVL